MDMIKTIREKVGKLPVDFILKTKFKKIKQLNSDHF